MRRACINKAALRLQLRAELGVSIHRSVPKKPAGVSMLRARDFSCHRLKINHSKNNLAWLQPSCAPSLCLARTSGLSGRPAQLLWHTFLERFKYCLVQYVASRGRSLSCGQAFMAGEAATI